MEDEPAVREIMTLWLTRAGGQVLTASNGLEALEVLAVNQVDLIISDVRMPVMDGVTLLKRLKDSGSQRPVVIFITGYSDLEPRDAYDMGAEALLEKPIERDLFIEVMKRSLMDRNALWQSSVEPAPQLVLQATFDGLTAALRGHQIAFGRGGFCIETPQTVREGPVGLILEFREDRKCLRGQGVVRWTSPLERQAGIELWHVDDQSRPWVIELTERSSHVAFIPRSAGSQQVVRVG